MGGHDWGGVVSGPFSATKDALSTNLPYDERDGLWAVR